MEVFLARQPILTKNQQVFGYELLYRNNLLENFSLIDDEQATLEVINSFIQIGIDDLSEGKPCFVNFTYKLLQNDIPTCFSPSTIVVEILETVDITNEVIDICRRLKVKGYKLALDDFDMINNSVNLDKILRIVDIVKIDVQKTSREQQLQLVKLLKKYNVELLAEKVETRDEYERCLQNGYEYFQGYYFSKPVILSTNDLVAQYNSFFTIMDELSKPSPDIDKIAFMIERDISISYKLLKLINSPLFGRLNEIKSIKQAIVLLGLKELSKWIYVLYIRNTATIHTNTSDEVIKMCLTRARTSELIAVKIGKGVESSSYFLTGLLSLIDTVLKQPIERVMDQLPLGQEIKDTIIGIRSPYSDVHRLVMSIEKGDWPEISKISERIKIDQSELSNIYINSIKWTKDVLYGTMKGKSK
ncbi:EAL and HDOD domain-containing protein [Alkalihalobacillus sp. BA299]|uniref:EAL and HDOD domain-containing protein n=1 Tax=Alkalihalobacillus sp. BA299 TaxID=2815938 RepID=UPI001ADAAF81|nr:HDOD domain-containing protein [Alkalihalobacillus sp. BA299]